MLKKITIFAKQHGEVHIEIQPKCYHFNPPIKTLKLMSLSSFGPKGVSECTRKKYICITDTIQCNSQFSGENSTKTHILTSVYKAELVIYAYKTLTSTIFIQYLCIMHNICIRHTLILHNILLLCV